MIEFLADAEFQRGLFVELGVVLVFDGHDLERELSAISVPANEVDGAVRAFAEFRENLKGADGFRHELFTPAPRASVGFKRPHTCAWGS